MKKIAFKLATYISIFFVLPILKLFGKKFYETNVVPNLLTVLCNTKPNHYQRQKIVPLATGDVVEIGVGPGLNLQYYNTTNVNKVIGIDPSDELNKIAKKNANKVNQPNQAVEAAPSDQAIFLDIMSKRRAVFWTSQESKGMHRNKIMDEWRNVAGEERAAALQELQEMRMDRTFFLSGLP